jgi:phosphopantetheinyl transferase
MKESVCMACNRMILHAESRKRPSTVYYASTGLSGDRNVIKDALVKELLRHGGFKLSVDRNAQLIRNDRYGCPQLDAQQSIALSFSSVGQEVWAAVSQADALGIDVEAPENFRAPYPYNRVFRADEFQHVSSFCTNWEDAAALLWSCKEAAMKNRGTGFHFIDPRDVRIRSCVQEGNYTYVVIVATPEKIPVVVRREGHLWLALAVSM